MRRVRETKDKNKNFELGMYAWGRFLLKANVYLENTKEPVVIGDFLIFKIKTNISNK